MAPLMSLLSENGEQSKNRSLDTRSFHVPDTLRKGFTSITQELLPPHPLQSLHDSHKQFEHKRQWIASTAGTGLAFCYNMERSITHESKRLPMLPSSNLLREIIDDKDEEIDFNDFLNLPKYSDRIIDVHE